MQLQLFLPCAAGVEDFLVKEAMAITQLPPRAVYKQRGGVMLNASWRDVMLLNLYSRLTQRVLVQLSYTQYRAEQDLYRAAMDVAWELWFTPQQTIKVEITAQHSPLNSLNFAALKVKDAVCDRFRDKAHGVRPDVNTQWPDVRIYAHLTTDACSLYIDTSGEPLFKRGWREDKGDAPLKETLAAAMIAASGWADGEDDLLPLYDPCCGSGTIAIEAAQIACNIAAGSLRRFAFEKYVPFQPHVWNAIKSDAAQAVVKPPPGSKPLIYGSDVSHRMVDFAQRNAERAGVADVVEFRGGDAPLKETLAAAMIAASGWADGEDDLLPLYDPCCGSGTIAIEAAQIACNIAAGSLRRFAFEKYVPFQPHVWNAIKSDAAQAVVKPPPGSKPLIYGSDVSHRMVDFAQRNAERAGVADVVEFRGGDALQRMPPIDAKETGGGVMLLNPPYGERIGVGGVAGEGAQARFGARELAHTDDGGEFFTQLASHWKKNFSGWTAWVLTPDLKLPGRMRLKESRRVPMWNGPLECRMFRFELVAGRLAQGNAKPQP